MVSLEQNENGCSGKGTPGGSGGERFGHLRDAPDDVVKVALFLVRQLLTGHILDHGPVISIIIIVIIIDFIVVVFFRSRAGDVSTVVGVSWAIAVGVTRGVRG